MSKQNQEIKANYGRAFNAAISKQYLIEVIDEAHQSVTDAMLQHMLDNRASFEAAGKANEAAQIIEALENGENIQPLASLKNDLTKELNKLFRKV